MVVLAACGSAAVTDGRLTPVTPVTPTDTTATVVPESQSRVVVDASGQLGPVMRLERATTHSTSSPLPGEPTRSYMQSLNHDVVRTWIQTRYVYNNGKTDYNYKYDLSDVGAEDALRFYATTAKSVLVALSAYNPTSQWAMPQGDSMTTFLTRTLVYYKKKYPNVRYIQVGNEPDANDETMDTYYPIYRSYYRAVNAANAELGLTGADRLLISNGPITSNLTGMLAYANPFFAAFAADKDPAKKLDYFSFHSYGDIATPITLATARQRIDDAMKTYGLAPVPSFVSEYGIFGGSTLPTGFTLDELITMQPAAQFTKAFYLYQGGVSQVFDWAIFHSTLPMKSQLVDVASAVRYPYGNGLLLAKEVSDRETRIAATSNAIDVNGLGTHVLASSKDGKGIAVLVWNFNWRNSTVATPFAVHVKNIARSAVGPGRVRMSVYIIDSKTNNYNTNKSQTSLQVTSTGLYAYAPAMSVTLPLEKQAVALVTIMPETP